MLELPADVLNGRSNVTFEFSLRTFEPRGFQTVLSAAKSTSENNEFLVALAGSRQIIVYNHGVSYAFNLGENVGDLTDGHWHHFAIVREQPISGPGQLRVYVDAAIVGGSQSEPSGNSFEALNVADTGLLIGQEQDRVHGGLASNQALYADLDELRFWQTARTADDIEASAGHAVDAEDENLIAYYRLDEGAVVTARDASLNGYDATYGATDLDLEAPQPLHYFRGAPSVAGVGDSTGDPRDDFAVIDDDSAGVHAMEPRDEVILVPGMAEYGEAPVAFSEVLGVIYLDAAFDLQGMAVRPAGHVVENRDQEEPKSDFLVTAEAPELFELDTPASRRNSYLVVGEDLAGGALEDYSIALGVSAARGVGDLNRDGFDDIGAAVLEAGPTLSVDDQAEVLHPVVQVLFGFDPELADVPPLGLVFEPDEAPFGSVGELAPDPFSFAGAGFVGGSLRVELLDAGEIGTTQDGQWDEVIAASAHGSSALVASASEIGVGHKWQIEGLDVSRRYDVRVQVPSASELGDVLARNVRYTVHGALTTTLQRSLEAADGSIRLGAFAPDSDGNLTVRLEPETDLRTSPETALLDDENHRLTFDFGDMLVVDNPADAAFDLRVRAVGADALESVEVQVSSDGVTFTSLDASSLIDDIDSLNGETFEVQIGTYDLSESGFAAVRYVRIQGNSLTPPPSAIVEAVYVRPAGLLVADALELTEDNDSLLVADPLGSQAWLWFGREPVDVPSDNNGDSGASRLDIQPFRFRPGTPLPTSTDDPRLGIDVLDATTDLTTDLDEAFAYEGSDSGEGLSGVVGLGDISGDGASDFMLVGESRAYVLFGPVDLTAVENVSEAAEFVVNLDELGRPAERVGDFDGDGFSDLLFVRTDPHQHTAIITVVAGRPDWPRLLDLTSLEALNEAAGDNESGRHIHTVQVVSTAFAADAEVHALDWNGDDVQDVILVAARPANDGTVAWLFSGQDVTDPGLKIGTPPNANESEDKVLGRIKYQGDSDGRLPLAEELLPNALVTDDDVTWIPRITARVPGDVDGDGRDDILLGDGGFLTFKRDLESVPDAGRVYLVPGGSMPGSELILETQSRAIWQGFAIGGSLSAVGDLDRDGYDEIALARQREGAPWAPGGLFVIGGSAELGAATGGPEIMRPEEAARLIVRRDAAEGLDFGTGFEGPPLATAGDFDADGLVDLAVGLPTDQLKGLGGGVIEGSDVGQLFVFFDAAALPGEVWLSDDNADWILVGEQAEGRFGSIAATPRLDFDGDRDDDLLVGAAGLDARETGLRSGAGKVYLIDGAARPSELPAEPFPLGNRSLTGGGFFLVDRGTGRPHVFKDSEDTSGLDDNPYVLATDESEEWFRFTTLGDGRGGNVIQLSPDAADVAFEIPAAGQDTLDSHGEPISPPGLFTRFGDDESDESYVAVYEFDLASLLSFVNGDDPLRQIHLVLPLQEVVEGGHYTLNVATVESDLQVTKEDRGTPASPTAVEVAAGATSVEIDVTRFVRQAWEEGKTRIAMRLDGLDKPLIHVLRPTLSGGPGPRLSVTALRAGVVGDLLDAEGVVRAAGRANIALRGLEAGTYFLRVYDPMGDRTEPLPFEIAVRAPIAGASHESDTMPDRDWIDGGEGRDIVVGNDDVDRLYGATGVDHFLAESIEVRDLAGDNEAVSGVPTAQASDRPRFDPDPVVLIVDPLLRGVVAQSLGLATTASYAGTPEVHETIQASDLASLVRLDAAGLGIEVLTGLEAATNLRSLSLGRNAIEDFWPLVPRRDERGDVVGLLSLETLTLDFTPGVRDALEPDSGVRLVETGTIGEPVPANLANAFGAKAFAKDVIADYPNIHEIAHLNDGLYGNDNSWIGESDGSFAGVALNGSHTIGLISFGRDNSGISADRYEGTYTLQYTTVENPSASTPEDVWLTIDELTYDNTFPPDAPALRHVYQFDPVEATGVRIVVSQGGFNGGIAIDEIEVLAPSTIAIEQISELASLRQLSLDGTHIVQPAPLLGSEGQRGGLADLGQLEWLSIDAALAWEPAGTRLADVSGLAGLEHMQVLSLRDNAIENVAPLARLDELRVLDLRNNAIQKVEALYGERVIDDSDSGYRELGSGFQGNLSPFAGAFEGDYRFRYVGVGDEVFGAFWTFEDVSSGLWEVLSSWPAANSRSDAVDYTYVTASPVVDLPDPFATDLAAPDPPPVAHDPDERNTVSIKTDEGQLTITGDDDDDDYAFYGVPFTAAVADGIAVFAFTGDLQIPADDIEVTGSNALSIRVTNDVYIDPGAVFLLGASETEAGPGGGEPGDPGGGGAAGAGNTLAADPGAGGAGGAGGTPFHSGKTGTKGGIGNPGSDGDDGGPGTDGAGGGSGVNNEHIGTGGAAGAAGSSGLGGSQQDGGAGGGGGKGGSGQDGKSGVSGSGEAGKFGGDGGAGGHGEGGLNDGWESDPTAISGGSAGGAGGGGGGGGGGGSGSGGSGGGGGGGEAGGWGFYGERGGYGGSGGAGGTGGDGSSGTGGGLGGAGGGAVEIVAFGRLEIGNATFHAEGGDGEKLEGGVAPGEPGDGQDGKPADNSGRNAGRGSGGGAGGYGADGGRGGDGGQGGAGAPAVVAPGEP